MIKQLYEYNIEIQKLCHSIIMASAIQDYDCIRKTIDKFKNLIEVFLKKCSDSNIVFPEEYMLILYQTLGDIVTAMDNVDYILIADQMEINFIPLLVNIQDFLRAKYDVLPVEELLDYNLQKLKEKNAFLYELIVREKKILDKTDEFKFSLELTNSGLFTLVANCDNEKFYLHGNNNPQRDGRLFAEFFFNPQSLHYIVYGLGLGYHCEELSEVHDGARIDIYESNLQVILYCMMARKIDWLWNNDGIQIIYDPQFKTFASAIRSITEIDVKSKEVLVMHYPSIRIITDKKIREKMERLFMRDNGIRMQGSQMEINFVNNITSCKKNIDELKDLFLGRRVVIVAAGPSLDKNVKELKKKTNDIIIMAVGSAYKKLSNENIEVDYVIISDAQKELLLQFENLWDKKVPIIVLSTAYYGCARKYSGDKYLVFQKDFPLAEEEAQKRNCSVYRTGGSVSTVALDVCIKLGFKEICFVGLDLAYTEGYSHAEDIVGNRKTDINGLNAVPGYNLINGKIQQIDVYSNRLFDSYRSWIEKRILCNDVNCLLYDATEGGAIIEGMKIVSLKQFMEM